MNFFLEYFFLLKVQRFRKRFQKSFRAKSDQNKTRLLVSGQSPESCDCLLGFMEQE